MEKKERLFDGNSIVVLLLIAIFLFSVAYGILSNKGDAAKVANAEPTPAPPHPAQSDGGGKRALGGACFLVFALAMFVYRLSITGR